MNRISELVDYAESTESFEVTIPAVELLTLAKVIVSGEGTITVTHTYDPAVD